ncbi:hypothetical protein ACVMB0_002024 [Bradyrhizobium sp. USDA 4451]
MTHPDLLVGPALDRAARRHRLAEQRPLRAIGGTIRVGEIRGDVPPLDPEFRMRAVIGGENEWLARSDGGKTFGALAEPCEALRKRLAAERQRQRAASEDAPRDGAASAH